MDDNVDPLKKGIIIQAASLIDIAPSSEFNFKVSVMSLKEGNYTVNIYFRNQSTNEYI